MVSIHNYVNDCLAFWWVSLPSISSAGAGSFWNLPSGSPTDVVGGGAAPLLDFFGGETYQLGGVVGNPLMNEVGN